MAFTPGPSGFKVYLYEPAPAAANGYVTVPGALMRVAADPRPGHTDVYGVNRGGQLWHSAKGDGSDWTQLPGAGVDVAVRSDGLLVVVGTSPA